MVYIAFLETTDNYASDKVIEAFHKMLEIAENKFYNNGDLTLYHILKEFRENDPTIGEEH